ncbi:MAG: sigma-70 family RNA polymerase sigma factor [Gloeotrichia echinulata GP01]
MVDLDEHLRRLVTQACQNPPGSPQRQKLLTQIIRLIAHRLWRESTPYYQDALQQTWLYFCRNICEGTTGQIYDSNYGTVITWLNAYLKRRLQDFYLNQRREQAIKVPLRIHQSGSGETSEVLDPLDTLPATTETPSILENVSLWAQTDPEGELRGTYIKGRPEVNCQVLIIRRLPPEVSWKELSEEFGLSIGTLSSFYQRQCLPRLRKFAEEQGYLED